MSGHSEVIGSVTDNATAAVLFPTSRGDRLVPMDMDIESDALYSDQVTLLIRPCISTYFISHNYISFKLKP